MASRAWQLVLDSSAQSAQPLFLRIARAITTDIRRGRLRSGERLPGTRQMAEQTGVHRNTTLAAYRELEAEGWIVTEARRGTFVATDLPEAHHPKARALGNHDSASFPLPQFQVEPAAPPPPGCLSLAGGIPDTRLLPLAELTRAYRRVVQRGGASVLGYGDPLGHPRLRAAVAAMLTSTRGMSITAEQVMITRGSQMALYLIGRVLLPMGAALGVEALGYRRAWEGLSSGGATLRPLPIDSRGLNTDAVATALRKTPFRGVYVTPQHQYPTMVTMSASRRLSLLELAAQAKMFIVEDDYDHEFHYQGRPVLPLASQDTHGVVIYVGSLAKVFAPGLRIGYVVGSPMLLQRLAAERIRIDRQGDHAVECAVAELMEEGELQRHVNRARRTYQTRRDLLIRLLRKAFGNGLQFQIPSGGMALWCSAKTNVSAWRQKAVSQGVEFHGAERFSFSPRGAPSTKFRLGFAALNETEIREAVRRLAATHPATTSR